MHHSDLLCPLNKLKKPNMTQSSREMDVPWLMFLCGKLLCGRPKYSVTKVCISTSAAFEKWFRS